MMTIRSDSDGSLGLGPQRAQRGLELGPFRLGCKAASPRARLIKIIRKSASVKTALLYDNSAGPCPAAWATGAGSGTGHGRRPGPARALSR